jgi:hypothetical protein
MRRVCLTAVTALGLLLFAAVAAAAPSLTVSATDAVIGGEIQATAELSESPSATGEISFEVFAAGDPTCSEPPLDQSTVTVSGEGQYVSEEFDPPAPGTYNWSAHYSGDGENEPADSVCSAGSEVTKATPGLTGNASDAVVGTAIHDEVTLTGGFSPTGEVTFSVYAPGDTTCSTPLDTDTVPIDDGAATSPNFLPQQTGEFRWTAEYTGDANNEPVSLACGADNQISTVTKASPSLSGDASSGVVGTAIRDQVTLTGGFSPTGEVTFSVYGPTDTTCSTPLETESVPIAAGSATSPDFLAQQAGEFRWTASYSGDVNNEPVSLACGAANQASAVGTIDVSLVSNATGGTVGTPVTAGATLGKGASPAGQITLRAFSPGDVSCTGAPAFSSSVNVSGNGTYRSAPFAPTRVGTYRWTATYSGDPNHAPATTGCGAAASQITQAQPSISGAVPPRITVGTAFSDIVTLRGGFAPRGTITFRIYGPVSSGCAKPAFVNTVAVNGNGTFSSDPFVTLRPGRYSFVASYSGDAANQSASEPCDSPAQVVQIGKRAPKVKPRAVLVGGKQISIRARLSGSVAPSGALTFRLYGPNDKRCSRKPAFSGAISIKRNGTFSMGRYLATKPGTYRLGVGYSGDKRNKRYKASCSGAQSIRVK